MPADHEAQSQVKEKRRSAAKSEGTPTKPHPEERRDLAEIKCGDARVHDREKQESSAHVKGSNV